MASKPKRFLFLEIRDRDFNAFYDDLIWTINGFRPVKPPHLTVRGPYQNAIRDEEIAKHKETLKHAVLEVGGLGRFSNPDEEVVYLTLDDTRLRRVWWKPDYPISEYGFNPHISIYRGRDHRLADRLMRFAPLQEARFLIAEFELVRVVKDKSTEEGFDFREFNRSRDHRRFEDSRGLPKDFFQRLADHLAVEQKWFQGALDL